ncbi:MAG: hypothetical protein LBN02_01295, partial [Oscillospiraceae bacterium]|nr:hypothetical protein [Oscillospiraceae bacterium]
MLCVSQRCPRSPHASKIVTRSVFDALRFATLSALAARRYFLSRESNQSSLEGTHRALLASVRREN